MNDQVLVLNQNYEPLNVTNARRAVTLLYLGKAVVVEKDSKVFRSPTVSFELPTVVRLAYYVKRPTPQLKLTRRSIIARDAHRCQYCGKHAKEVTIDHVIPRDRAGKTDWKNLVCACIKCNNKKGNRTPQEAGMALTRKPTRPRYVPYISFSKFVAAFKHERWIDYLAPFAQGLDIEQYCR
jgi:5-methylcytosine-specific restriction endonuclease McrA